MTFWRAEAMRVDSSLDSELAVEMERKGPSQDTFGNEVGRT